MGVVVVGGRLLPPHEKQMLEIPFCEAHGYRKKASNPAWHCSQGEGSHSQPHIAENGASTEHSGEWGLYIT